MPGPPTVRLAPEAGGLLALLLVRLLGRAVAVAPDAAARLAGRRVRLRADAQVVTLVGDGAGLCVAADDGDRVDVEIRGDLASLLAAGRGRWGREVLGRRLRVRGRFWRAWPLLRLFAALAAHEDGGQDAAGQAGA